MKCWTFYFDQTRCVNCKACVLACKGWNEDRRGDAERNPELSWILTDRYEEPRLYENPLLGDGNLNYEELSKYHMKENWRRVYSEEYGDRPPYVDILNLSISCNHCDEPACMEACPLEIIKKDSETGIVFVQEDKPCIACERCKKACPWDSPQYYTSPVKGRSVDSARPHMTKCDLCMERIKAGRKPACVAACSFRALDAGPKNEIRNRYPNATEDAELFPLTNEGMKCKPNILFKKKERRFMEKYIKNEK